MTNKADASGEIAGSGCEEAGTSGEIAGSGCAVEGLHKSMKDSIIDMIIMLASIIFLLSSCSCLC